MLTTVTKTGLNYGKFIYYCIFCFVVLPILLFMTPAGTPFIHQLLAIILMLICIRPGINFLVEKSSSVPLMGIICIAYAGGYALPIFISKPELSTAFFSDFVLHEDSITYVLVLSILGVLSMQLGFRLISAPWMKFKPFILQINYRASSYLFFLWMLSLAIELSRQFLFSSSSTVLYYVLLFLMAFRIIPIILLYGFYLREKLTSFKKIMFILLFAFQILLGLSSGSLNNFVLPILAVIFVYWFIKQKIPLFFIGFLILSFIILQPVKAAYRQAAWFEGYQNQSIGSRLQLWKSAIFTSWSDKLSGGSQTIDETARSTFSRGDYLHLFAYVTDLTPSEIPYQLGKTYSYFLVTLIPRAIWKSKPIATDADNFFGVSYGFVTDKTISTTVVGMPQMVEAFINFGMIGVIVIMMIIGMIYGVFNALLNNSESGNGCQAILIALVGDLNSIGASAVNYFGSSVQYLIIFYLILTVMRERTNKQ